MFSKIDEAVETVPELKEIYKAEDAARTHHRLREKIEGVARHASTHACGVLITKASVVGQCAGAIRFFFG